MDVKFSLYSNSAPRLMLVDLKMHGLAFVLAKFIFMMVMADLKGGVEGYSHPPFKFHSAIYLSLNMYKGLTCNPHIFILLGVGWGYPTPWKKSKSWKLSEETCG